MSTTRDINAAWDETKKRAAKLYPDKFILDKRNVLQWNDGSVRVLDERISSANFKRLNELAEKENYSVDALVTKLISHYKNRKQTL
jgi:predicted DNA-binding ribbon-helix-helix protein